MKFLIIYINQSYMLILYSLIVTSKLVVCWCNVLDARASLCVVTSCLYL